MSRILVFDVETTGLPTKYKPSITELDVWPRIVQISWIVYDASMMDLLKLEDHIIKLPKNMRIPESSTKIHGITNEMMKEKGKDLQNILNKFYEDLNNANIIVAHNLEFDKSMVQVESIRRNLPYEFINKAEFCTMKNGENICKLTRVNKYNKVVSKFPKLIELYDKLFNEVPNNLHNSLNDILVCFRCYFKMRYNLDLLVEDTAFAQFECF